MHGAAADADIQRCLHLDRFLALARAFGGFALFCRCFCCGVLIPILGFVLEQERDVAFFLFFVGVLVGGGLVRGTNAHRDADAAGRAGALCGLEVHVAACGYGHAFACGQVSAHKGGVAARDHAQALARLEGAGHRLRGAGVFHGDADARTETAGA